MRSRRTGSPSRLRTSSGAGREARLCPPPSPSLATLLGAGIRPRRSSCTWPPSCLVSWILDPAPIPPSATIPGLAIGGRADELARSGRGNPEERHFVIKPSDFLNSPGAAWRIGRTRYAAERMGRCHRQGPGRLSSNPYILQEFHKGRLYELDYFDPVTGEMNRMSGRARLSHLLFREWRKTELAGILATICPANESDPRDEGRRHGAVRIVQAHCMLSD